MDSIATPDRPLIALAMGDPAGISPELTARLLADSDETVSEICYHCGFNNLSNFNRIFLKKKKCTPKTFRETYRKTKIII